MIIALPSHLHAPAALAALETGLHVFVETPMALSVADAKQVARKAADKNLVLAVGQQRRYNWIYDHALEMVRLNLLDRRALPPFAVARPEAGKEADAAACWRPTKAPQAPKAGELRSIGGRTFPRKRPA